MSKMYISFILILLGLVFLPTQLSCRRTPIAPKVLVSNKDIEKEIMNSDKNFQGVTKKSVRFEYGDNTHGYFRKSDTHVMLQYIAGSPVSQLQCFDEKHELLWRQSSQTWPTNRLGKMIIHEGDRKSLILVLLHGDKANYVVVLEETGQIQKIVKLITHRGSSQKFYHLSAFSWQENLYIAATSGGRGIGIFNFDGQMLQYLTTLENPVSIAGLAMKGKNEQPFFVIFANHLSTTRSSILFVLSEQWDVLYKEVLETGKWIGKKGGTSGDELILSTFCWGTIDCQDGERIWKYSLY